VGVPFVAADLVGGARSEPADVEGVKADLGLRHGLANGALVLAAHVDRDRADRCLAVTELGEELGQSGAVAARSAPHNRPGPVVGHAGQVAVMAAIADLVDADADQVLEPALVEVLGDHARDDPPDGVPADPQQAADRGARHLLGQPRDDVLEVARVRRARARPWHRLQSGAAIATAQAPQLALDDAPAGAEIEVAPALDAPVVDLQLPTRLPTTRAYTPPAPQADGHDHPLGPERDVGHAGAGQAQQALECGGDAHVALPVSR
jgi:hypothetical protein